MIHLPGVVDMRYMIPTRSTALAAEVTMASLNVDRFEQYIADGRITHGKWLDTDAHGREVACFYAALAPDGVRTEPGACPAEALQPWIAYLLPWLDDQATTEDERYAAARRLVPVMRRVALPEYQEALRRADYACRAIVVREAISDVPAGTSLGAERAVLLLLDRAAAGETISVDEWQDAASARRVRRWAGAAAAVEPWAAVVAVRVATAANADTFHIADAMLATLEAAVGLRGAP